MAITYLMSYKDFAQRVLSAVGDPKCRRFYPGEIEQWINDAVRFMVYRLAQIDPEAVVCRWKPTLLEGQYEYEIERTTFPTLPSDVWRILSVTVDGTVATPVSSVEEFYRIKAGQLAHQAKSGSGPVWAFERRMGSTDQTRKQAILVWPIPTATVNEGLYVRLIWCPVPMQDEDDDFPLPNIYVPAAQRYVEEKYFAAAGVQRNTTPEQAALHWLGIAA